MSAFLNSLKLTNFLSFGPDSPTIELTPLNVLIGPNASGKSNFIEAFELLHATPTDISDAIRIGGTAAEWLWKGASPPKPATIEARICASGKIPELRHRLSFTEANSRLEIVDEALEEAVPRYKGKTDVFFYYRFQNGHPVINVRQTAKDEESKTQRDEGQSKRERSTFNLARHLEERDYKQRRLQRESLNPEQSVLAQRKDPEAYPELTRVGKQFGRIQIYREWVFGRTAPLRKAQAADLPSDELLPTIVNLGLVLNDLEHQDSWPRFLELMQRFLPRFKRLTTKIQGGSVQIYLHEEGLKTPIPATRLSDGTIRFLALLAILLNPGPAPVICIEEPELGLHPDALALLADLLVEASAKTQLVVTTHSDVLVSALTEHATSILTSEHLAGGTQFRRLEPDKLKTWLQKYRLGEVWRLGKLGGNP
jgi:predicted ATPase